MSLWKIAIIGLLGCTTGSAAMADVAVPVSWLTCFNQAGFNYGLAPELLTAIAHQESGFNPSAVRRNADQSWDVGLMQINSRWFPALKAAGIKPSTLYEPCTSIWVGAWILAQFISRHGYTWESVGAYNAGERRDSASSRRRAQYALQIRRRLDRGGSSFELRDRLASTGIADYPIAGSAGSDSSRRVEQR